MPTMKNTSLIEIQNLKGIESLNVESSHYKVLVVDDNEPMRKLIVSLLSTKGHHCVTASNGIEALDKIMEAKYDALITDIVMPEMDGIALTKELSKHYQSLPVMVITGHPEDYSAETAIASGAREFIHKPFSISEFLIRFDKMMRDMTIGRRGHCWVFPSQMSLRACIIDEDFSFWESNI